jgi:outer membrane receptor protein involved in Fe transport
LSWGDALRLRGEYQFHSRNPGPFVAHIPTSPAYIPLEVPNPATHLFNARVGYIRDKLEVNLFVNNVFNAHPLLGEYSAAATSAIATYSTFRPRTVGMSANYAF